jgi:two-component system, LytTR family, sensor kinase
MAAPARVDWRFVVVATLILTCLVTLSRVGGSDSPAFSILHDRQMVAWIIWAILSPLIIVAARRFPFGEGSALRWLFRHLAVGAVFALASIAITAAVAATTDGTVHAIASASGASFVSAFATGLLLYALIACSYQAVAYHRTVRERDAVASRLRADLAEARLANLEGKLHPHFLFNSLNSIAALVRVDPRQAEVMIEQLSELLRATLRTNPMQEVPLDEALRITEQYLAIEQIRFQHRLRATVEASVAARRGKVPQLLLQTLVENAVRHGIGPREAGGSVTVTASVERDTLRMTVEEDGVGIGNAPSARAGGGLGLGSVRSILSHLYGSDQHLDVSARIPSGTKVTVIVPYRPVAA